jgi:uncharacterized membrane protein (UPF0127 family)
MQSIIIQNITHPLPYTFNVDYCSSFFSRLFGLMFRRNLNAQEGILLVEKSQSKINTSIHMFFMNFDIAAVWIDANKTVVDVQLARRWRPYYASSSPAQYVLETHINHLSDFKPGDHLTFTHAA